MGNYGYGVYRERFMDGLGSRDNSPAGYGKRSECPLNWTAVSLAASPFYVLHKVGKLKPRVSDKTDCSIPSHLLGRWNSNTWPCLPGRPWLAQTEEVRDWIIEPWPSSGNSFRQPSSAMDEEGFLPFVFLGWVSAGVVVRPLAAWGGARWRPLRCQLHWPALVRSDSLALHIAKSQNSGPTGPLTAWVCAVS